MKKRMTVTYSKLTLVCAAFAMGLAVTPAPALAQQRASDEHVRDLAQQAARLVASGQTSALTTAQQGGQDTAPAADRKWRCTLDDAVKLALDRNLDIAVQRLNPQISDLAYRQRPLGLQPCPDGDGFIAVRHQPVDQHDHGWHASGPASPTAPGCSTAGSRRTCPGVGAVIRSSLNNQRGTSTATISRYNPSYTPDLVGSVHPAAAARVQDRLDASTAAGDKTQPRHLRRPVDVARSPTRCRTCATPTGTTCSRSSRSKSRGSPSIWPNKLVEDNQTRVADRDHGADRRRAGAVAGRHGGAEPRDGAGDEADRRARAEAADRQRHAGPNWNAAIDPVDRPDFRPEDDRHRGGDPRARSASAPT